MNLELKLIAREEQLSECEVGDFSRRTSHHVTMFYECLLQAKLTAVTMQLGAISTLKGSLEQATPSPDPYTLDFVTLEGN